MIPSWARVGAKVVCIDTGFYGVGSMIDVSLLIKGETYIISKVGEHPLDGAFVQVVGIDCFSSGFRISRFRPLITEADDIALFKSLLNPTLVDKLDLLAERMNELAED